MQTYASLGTVMDSTLKISSSTRTFKTKITRSVRSHNHHVFNDVEQCLTMALFTLSAAARADGGSASPR